MRSLLLCALAGAIACSPAEPQLDLWRVEEGFIRDPEGRAVIMRGVNLSGSHKRAPYLSWHGSADFARIRDDWGMGSLRFLISWTGLQPAPDRFDEAYLERVAQRMDWAAEHGLLVVLDMHQDVYGEGFGGNGAPRWSCGEDKYAAHEPVSPWFLNYSSPPVMSCFDRLYTDEAIGAHFAEAWRRVAQRLADHPAVVGFDPLNEPHWGSHNAWTFERERLQPFYERVVAAVREVAPSWIAFLEPASSRNLGLRSSLQPFSLPDVVYAPHSYDAGAEQGEGFDPQRRQALIDNLAALGAEARRLSAALWIGEYGGVADDPGIAEYMDAQYDGAGKVAASTIYWEHGKGGGYELLDAEGAPKPPLQQMLVRPYPRRVAGDPREYSFDEQSRRFELRLRAAPEITAPTVIAAPARVYPHGYRVACGGCVVEERPGEVQISRLPAGEQTIVIEPK